MIVRKLYILNFYGELNFLIFNSFRKILLERSQTFLSHRLAYRTGPAFDKTKA